MPPKHNMYLALPLHEAVLPEYEQHCHRRAVLVTQVLEDTEFLIIREFLNLTMYTVFDP